MENLWNSFSSVKIAYIMWLYRLLLSFLHIILYLRIIVLEILWKIRRFIAGVFGSRGTSFNEIHLHSKRLNKLPLHISFLILESQIVFTDVAKLIVWAMALGISYISVFDRKGKNCEYNVVSVVQFHQVYRLMQTLHCYEKCLYSSKLLYLFWRYF